MINWVETSVHISDESVYVLIMEDEWDMLDNGALIYGDEWSIEIRDANQSRSGWNQVAFGFRIFFLKDELVLNLVLIKTYQIILNSIPTSPIRFRYQYDFQL